MTTRISKVVSLWILISLFFVNWTFASLPGWPYTPGQTNNPTCSPWDVNCDVDLSTIDDQTLSFSGNLLVIADGNSVDLSAYLDNTDSQTLTLSWSEIVISDGNSLDISGVFTDTNTQLDESAVDAFVANNGYLTGSTDTDDQTLSFSGNLLVISDGNSVDFSAYLDNTDSQALTLSWSEIVISGGNTIDISGVFTDTNTQLNESQVDALVANNGYLTGATDTDDQILSLSWSALSIADWNTVDLSSISWGTSTLSWATDTNLTGSATGSTLYFDGTDWIDLDVWSEWQILTVSSWVLVWATPSAIAANDRSFASDTTVSPAISANPTVVEIQAWATSNSVTDTIITYNGTDTSGAVTYAYHSDNSGTVTLLRTPDSANEDLAIFFIDDQVETSLINGLMDWWSATPSINNVGTWSGTQYTVPNSGFYEVTWISSVVNQSSQADDTFNYDIRVNAVVVSTQTVDPMAYAGNGEQAQIIVNAIIEVEAGDVIDSFFSGVSDTQNYTSKSLSIKQLSKWVYIDPDLLSVDNSWVSNWDALIWNSTNGQYEPSSISWGSSTLSWATDTNFTSLAIGSTLYYDGTEWIDLDIGTQGQTLTSSGGTLAWASNSATEDVRVLLGSGANISNAGTVSIGALTWGGLEATGYEAIEIEWIPSVGAWDSYRNTERLPTNDWRATTKVVLFNNSALSSGFTNMEIAGNTVEFFSDWPGISTVDVKIYGVKGQKTVIDVVNTPTNDQSTSGYMDIGDMRMQWGRSTVTVLSGLNNTLVFPVNFSNTDYSLSAQVTNGGEIDLFISGADSLRTTNSTIFGLVDDNTYKIWTYTIDWQVMGLK